MAMIYKLECITNGFAYIGSSKNLQKRFREHRCLLRANKHSEPLLQADWDRLGEAAFRIVHLENTTSESLDERRAVEMRWMGVYRDKCLLYNTKLFAFQPPPGAAAKAAKTRTENGYTPSAETRLKRRLAQLGKPKGHGAKISATKQAQKLMR